MIPEYKVWVKVFLNVEKPTKPEEVVGYRWEVAYKGFQADCDALAYRLGRSGFRVLVLATWQPDPM